MKKRGLTPAIATFLMAMVRKQIPKPQRVMFGNQDLDFKKL